MLTAISRYGARVLPNTQQIIEACRERRELIRGPQIQEFERAFENMLGHGEAVATSYARMAFYYILKAFQLPPGSEVVFPALTFWVVPEVARVLNLKPVFADVDAATFNIRPDELERVITPRTRAVVPTHLYGLPCDMDAILAIAKKHGLIVIEDCAHAMGASYRGKPVGTFGHAAFFSFQMLKPLNTYGGGVAVLQDSVLAAKVARFAQSEPWPEEREVLSRLLFGRLQRIFIRPRVFTFTAFPLLLASSLTKLRLDVYLWEKIRPLSPLPKPYRQRYSNVQAAMGLAGLKLVQSWTDACRENAKVMDSVFAGIPGVRTPEVPKECTHVYYQYCLYVPNRDLLVKQCIRRGLDLETLHVDVCSQLALFGDSRAHMPNAENAANVVQIPVYASLTNSDAHRVASCVRQALQQRNNFPGGGRKDGN